jgi:hypothetical protein
MLWHVVRMRDAERMAPVCGAFIENHQFRMQIISQRNGEEKQYKSAGKGGPFLQRFAPMIAALVQPASPPETETGGGDPDPQKIEKRLHRSLFT